MSTFAVIDLGTNTFHLIIAQSTIGGYKILHRERVFVRLAEGGIQTIGEGALQRGLQALESFRKLLKSYEVQQVRAFGTAALRTASNAAQFTATIQSTLGIEIEIIDGLEEARLIHLGVREAVTLPAQPSLIMDIGGGSVEFILCDQTKVFWSQSFPIGVAVLLKQFHHQDPIASKEIEALDQYLIETLSPLSDQIAIYHPQTLIGASGTFDVIETMVGADRTQVLTDGLDIAVFDPIYQRLITSTLAEREAMNDLPRDRADMVVVAMELIRVVLHLAPITHLLISPFALKEGALAEMSAHS